MKQLFFVLLVLPSFLSAQEISLPQQPVLRHEIGINLFSVTDLDIPMAVNYFRKPDHYVKSAYHAVPGIFYKYHMGKNVLRASLDYDQQVTFIESGAEDLMYYRKVDAIHRTGGLRLGYERELGSKRFVPFVAGDVAFAYSNYQGKETWRGCFGGGENVPFTEHTYEAGISAGGGVKYKATNRLSVTLETTAQVFVRHYSRDDSPYAYTNIGFRYNPVRTLGVSWNF